MVCLGWLSVFSVNLLYFLLHCIQFSITMSSNIAVSAIEVLNGNTVTCNHFSSIVNFKETISIVLEKLVLNIVYYDFGVVLY